MGYGVLPLTTAGVVALSIVSLGSYTDPTPKLKVPSPFARYTEATQSAQDSGGMPAPQAGGSPLPNRELMSPG